MKLSLDDWDRKIANPCAKYPSPFTQTLEMPIDRAFQEVKGSQDPSPTHTDGRTLYRKRLRVYTLHNWKNKQKIWDYFFVVKFTSWCIFCIYKISYQILFGFTVEYVLARKSFLWKKCQSIIFWLNVEINRWYIIR